MLGVGLQAQGFKAIQLDPPLADKADREIRVPDLTAEGGITLAAALKPVADLNGPDSIKLQISLKAADVKVTPALLAESGAPSAPSPSRNANEANIKINTTVKINAVEIEQAVTSAETRQDPVYIDPSTYLAKLAATYGLTITYLKPNLTVAKMGETQMTIIFRNVDRPAWQKRIAALKQRGWQSTALDYDPAEISEPTARSLAVTGPAELMAEIHRWQNPITHALQDPQRLPLRYALAHVKAKVKTLPEHRAAERVKLADALAP